MIKIPESYNYIAAFLILNCNFICSYCINKYSHLEKPRKLLTGKQWIDALNNIKSRLDLPITLQGGEPSLHSDFYEIINGIDASLHIDLLTNLTFNIYEFMDKVNPDRLRRDSPYASIRVSYHPKFMEVITLTNRVFLMKERGYSIGIWGLDHPEHKEDNAIISKICKYKGIDFRLKEFLGWHNGKLYGSYKYEGACDGGISSKKYLCRTSELLIAPDGNVFNCHAHLYRDNNSIGNITDNFILKEIYYPCEEYGTCNPCDVKIKTNRFQEYGHTSVDIKEM